MKSQIRNPHKFSAHSDYKQKSFIPKKNIRHVSIRDFKNQKNDFWIVTRASARDYTVYWKSRIVNWFRTVEIILDLSAIIESDLTQ